MPKNKNKSKSALSLSIDNFLSDYNKKSDAFRNEIDMLIAFEKKGLDLESLKNYAELVNTNITQINALLNQCIELMENSTSSNDTKAKLNTAFATSAAFGLQFRKSRININIQSIVINQRSRSMLDTLLKDLSDNTADFKLYYDSYQNWFAQTNKKDQLLNDYNSTLMCSESIQDIFDPSRQTELQQALIKSFAAQNYDDSDLLYDNTLKLAKNPLEILTVIKSRIHNRYSKFPYTHNLFNDTLNHVKFFIARIDETIRALTQSEQDTLNAIPKKTLITVQVSILNEIITLPLHLRSLFHSTHDINESKTVIDLWNNLVDIAINYIKLYKHHAHVIEHVATEYLDYKYQYEIIKNIDDISQKELNDAISAERIKLDEELKDLRTTKKKKPRHRHLTLNYNNDDNHTPINVFTEEVEKAPPSSKPLDEYVTDPKIDAILFTLENIENTKKSLEIKIKKAPLLGEDIIKFNEIIVTLKKCLADALQCNIPEMLVPSIKLVIEHTEFLLDKLNNSLETKIKTMEASRDAIKAHIIKAQGKNAWYTNKPLDTVSIYTYRLNSYKSELVKIEDYQGNVRSLKSSIIKPSIVKSSIVVKPSSVKTTSNMLFHHMLFFRNTAERSGPLRDFANKYRKLQRSLSSNSFLSIEETVVRKIKKIDRVKF